MVIDDETLEGGGLLPVLQRASHEELKAVVEALNKGLDVFITWDTQYTEHQNDLTKIPKLIGDYLCRAGGHLVANTVRGAGPDYASVVADVCKAMSVPAMTEPNVVAMEEALLNLLLERAMKGMSDQQKAELLKKMADAAGRPVGIADVMRGGALFALLAPYMFAFLAEQMAVAGVAFLGKAALGRFASMFAGPVGLAIGVIWTAADMAGPSLRGTVPAVAQVAMIRQRLLWGGAA